jgi:hypothetical protein
MLQFILGLATGIAADLAAAAGGACSFDGSPLQCAPGEVIGSVEVAEFGMFTVGSSCTKFTPLPSCPNTTASTTTANVRAQVDLLCRGTANCSVSCSCSSPAPSPPSPGPPTPGPQPPSPRGFHAVVGRDGKSGSCRDSTMREPPFYANSRGSAETTLLDCEATCAADPECACHILFASTSKTVPPFLAARRHYAPFWAHGVSGWARAF